MMWAYIIPAISAIAVAIIEARAARREKKSDAERKADNERTNRRAEQRAEESMLSMQLMAANCALSTVTAKAVLHQHTNGDVEEAMTAAKSARERYDNFIKRLAANQVAKP